MTRNVRAAVVGALAVALLALVALGSRQDAWRGGGDREVSQHSIDYAYTLLLLLLVGAVVVVATQFRALRVARSGGDRSTGLVAIVIVCALVAAAYAGTTHRTIRLPTDRGTQNGRGAGAPGARATDAPGRTREPRVQWWLVATVGAAAAAGTYLLLRSRDPERPPRAELAEQLEAVLTDTLDDLESEADPRAAVIRAYARMETVLAAHGLPRRPSEAPLEYLARVLRELRVRAEAAHALTELFERAKFSQHEIDVAMKLEAIAALATVRDDLKAAA